MRRNQDILTWLIMLLLAIPIGIYYLIKWIIKGIVTIVVTLKQD